jgi:predicted transposase YbfD/YdcC
MDTQATAKMLRHFEPLPDPRARNRQYSFTAIVAVALFAVICGAEGWVAVVAYGRAKLDWLKTFLDLPDGIPSHDTFNDVFSHLNPEAFEACFRQWMASVVQLAGGTLVAIDGKSLRRSFEHGWDKSGMAHMVSAFVHANRMVFAQVKTDGKGHELSAIEQLLGLLELNGAVVSIDAIACNRNIAQKILDAKGQYLLQVKGNQSTLETQLQVTLDDARRDHFAGLKSDYHEQVDGDHGRNRNAKAVGVLERGVAGRGRGGLAGPAGDGPPGMYAGGQREDQHRTPLLHQFSQPADQGPENGGLCPGPLEC